MGKESSKLVYAVSDKQSLNVKYHFGQSTKRKEKKLKGEKVALHHRPYITE